ncbi:hypothetical protein K1T71_001599 [Dendrolimus kikuchii]|uniref:Uncharacterized protein n=1 Tax=Dendrolimus kikuchii TaxID=765133 RepID=A0ACC1DEK8_9NEOP|nr:hypothetical protein K1T71_001599 [Dendrolimus kikuchii]
MALYGAPVWIHALHRQNRTLLRRAQRRRKLGKNLCRSLFFATQVVDTVSEEMYADQYQWQRTLLGHTFSVSRPPANNGEGRLAMMNLCRSWLASHEEAQVMIASVLVVIGVWWLVRALLSLVINLICPLLVVLLAVICVPQLRTPLLGQNYPALASLLRCILLKLAENIKTE